MTDVAIIGTGRTPFGRFPDQSAIEMGAQAVRAQKVGATSADITHDCRAPA